MMTRENDAVANIAANIGANLGGCAFMLGRLIELIDEDDARAEPLIDAATRQSAADALRDALTHWSAIGRYSNDLDDKLPPPTPLEDPNEP